MDNTIRTVKVNDYEFYGDIKWAELVFDPHHVINLEYNEENEFLIHLISTHHGICLKASTGGILTELEDGINTIRRANPESGVDRYGSYPASKTLSFDNKGILISGGEI